MNFESDNEGESFMGDIYAVEARVEPSMLMRPPPGRILRSGTGRNRGGRNHGTAVERMYHNIHFEQQIQGGFHGKDDWYQDMGEMNYPADEQFRKESQILRNRVERDRNMRRKKMEKDAKLMKKKEKNVDELVIPCAFPSAMNLKQDMEDEERVPHSSTVKIAEFLAMPRSNEQEYDIPTRADTVERLMAAHAVRAAAAHGKRRDSICISFEDYPPVYQPRDRMLRTIVIDGCAVMKQVNPKYEVAWNPNGGAPNTFRGNKLLVMRPLIELAMRFLLQGHKTVVLLPQYYMIPVYANLRQKVDDIPAFNALVKAEIVKFIEEASIEDMLITLLGENQEVDGTFVSNSALEYIVETHTRAREQRLPIQPRNDFDEPAVAKKQDKKEELFRNRLTPFFYDNKLILPLHMSNVNKVIIYGNKLLYYNNSEVAGNAEIVKNQLTMEEQKKILLSLQDLFELPVRLLRGMMVYRRILKEIEDAN